MSNIIIGAPSAWGETAPLIEIARGLIRHYHEVTIIGGSEFMDAATSTGAAFVPLTGDADFTRERAAEFFRRRRELAPGPDQLNFDFRTFFIDPMLDEFEKVQRLLAERPDSALISNAMFLGGMPTALGAPGRRPSQWIAVGANPLVIASDDATPFGPIPGLSGEEARVAHRAANAAFAAALEPSRERFETHISSLGGTPLGIPFMESVYRVPDVFASLSVAEFDFPRTDDPASLKHVGILWPEAAEAWDPPAWWSELDDDRPTIVVTQGTVANSDLGELIGPALAAFAEVDAHVIAALGRSVADSGLTAPANTHLVDFIPFSKLLRKADLLVTNGGFGSTQLALAAGVPVIVAGETEDKAFTAARVAFHGIGCDLRTGTPTPDQIHDAYKQVLASQPISDAVTQLGRAYAAKDPVEEIEKLVRHYSAN